MKVNGNNGEMALLLKALGYLENFDFKIMDDQIEIYLSKDKLYNDIPKLYDELESIFSPKVISDFIFMSTD